MVNYGVKHGLLVNPLAFLWDGVYIITPQSISPQ